MDAFDIREFDVDSPGPAEERFEGLPAPQIQVEVSNPLVQSYYNQQAPTYVLQHEKPEHRAICILVAEGLSNVEIAEKTGHHPSTISYVRKQPWAVEFISKMQGEMGQHVVKQILSGGAAAAAQLIVNQIKDSSLSANIRNKSANDLLNRLFGVAPQLVKHEKVNAEDLSNEELAAIVSSGSETRTK